MEHARRIASLYTPYLLFSSGVLGLSSANFAFDVTAFSQTQAMDAFDRDFGHPNGDGTYSLSARYLALLNGLPYLGQLIGLWLSTWCMQRFGRRVTVFCMACWAIISAIVLVTSHSRGQVMAGRIMNYAYIGAELIVIPAYQAEIVPAGLRGFAIGSYQMSFTVAALVMASICRHTSDMSSSAAWRIPYGLFFIVPTLVASGIWFAPESPRWLCMMDRWEDARKVLRDLRVGAKTDESIIDEEINLIALSLQSEKNDASWFDLVRHKVNRRRTALVVFAGWSTSATGQVFTTSYSSIFIASLHTINPFTMAIINNALSLVACLLAMFLMDKVGRRQLYIGCVLMQAVFLASLAGTGMQSPQTHTSMAYIVACIPLFNFFFNSGYASSIHALVAEIPEQRLRSKSQFISGFANIGWASLTASVTPYLLNAPYADLGPKVGFVYLPFAIGIAILGYFFVPEVKDRSLDEVDLLFSQGISALQSRKWHPESTADGLAMVVGVQDTKDALAHVHHVSHADPEAAGAEATETEAK